jgi:hypothetical protein
MDTEKKNGNGTWKSVLIGIITIGLSIAGSTYTSGLSAGQQAEKILNLEKRVEQFQTDHDILVTIKVKVENIEAMLKELKEKK